MYDLSDFQLSDMVRLDAGLRSCVAGSESMEQAADALITRLADQLVDKETGQRSCVLARLFVTLPLGRLEAPLDEVARTALETDGARAGGSDDVRCLTLLATVGDEQDWCSRRTSRAHRVLPLPTAQAVQRSPMVSELLRQLGVDAAALTEDAGSGLLVARPGASLGVFHVEHAAGSPHVPAQEEFVSRFGVRSVLGFGGILPGGELYAVVCFSRTPVPRATAEKFTTVAASFGLGLLPHVDGRVFDSDLRRPSLPDEARERWRANALADLLTVHEASVLEQSLRLERALGGLEDRALELHRTRAAISRSEALKSAMLASALDAVVSIDAEGRIIEWNPAAEQTFGRARADVLGQQMVELLVPARLRDAHLAGFARYLSTGEEVILGRRVEIEALHADGHEVPVELTVSRSPTTGPPVFTAFLRDVSQQRRAAAQRQELLVAERSAREAAEHSAQQLRRLQEVGAALGEAMSSEDVARLTLSVALRQVGAVTGAVWLHDLASAALSPLFGVGPSIGLLHRASVPLSSTLPVAVACRDGRPVWVGSRAEGAERFPDWAAEATDHSARSFAVLPLRAEQTDFGALVVGFDDERDLPSGERTFLVSVAGQRAQALHRAKLHDRERAAAARLAFLAEAGRTLGTSLDSSTTLQQVTELSLTVLGRLCVVHLVDPATGALHQVAWAHEDAERSRLLERLRHYQPPPDTPLDIVLRTARTLVLPGLSDEDIRAATTTPEEYELATALTLGPTIIVPLVARGTTIGTLTVGGTPDQPPYDADAVSLAEALAERAAAAIDNSRAHAARTEIALTLQRAMMPLDLSSPSGLQLGFRYQPGTVDTEVGGDWFDVLPLSVGRAAVVIGDVMGRGIHAAAVMGQLRAAVRAYASLDLAPDTLMTELDSLVQGLGDGGLVTCVYGVLDALTGELTLCNAGHVPPVVLADGLVSAVELPTGAPLGVGGIQFETASITVPLGGTVVMYTDGMVESRHRDVHTGIGALTDLLATLPADDLDALCDRALRELVGVGGHDDDAAILAIRRSALGGPFEAQRLVLEKDVAAVPRVRAEVVAILLSWGMASIADTAALLAGELLANAVRHAGGGAELRVGVTAGVVCVEVHDDHAGAPRLQEPDPDSESGRGLLLLDAMSERWGVRRSARGGKAVWFELSDHS